MTETPPPPAWALRVAGGLLLAAGWELAGRASDSLLLPSCLETLTALAHLAGGPDLWRALAVSNEALVLGFGTAMLAGVPLGFVLGRVPRLDAWLDPYLYMLLALPTTALVPLVMITLGIERSSRVLLVSLFAFPMVVECVREGVRRVDPRLSEMATAFGATPWQLWRRVVLPGAVPALVTGARLGLARAIDGMIVVELIMVAVGVGRLLLDFQGRFDAPAAYAVILAVMAEAVLLTQAGRLLERRLAPWQVARGRQT